MPRSGAAGAEYPVVNDLDLVVVDGEGMASSRYYGNRFVPGGFLSRRYVSWFGPTPDYYNNVELIRIDPAQIVYDDFTVEVTSAALGGKAVPGRDHWSCGNQ